MTVFISIQTHRVMIYAEISFPQNTVNTAQLHFQTVDCLLVKCSQLKLCEPRRSVGVNLVWVCVCGKRTITWLIRGLTAHSTKYSGNIFHVDPVFVSKSFKIRSERAETGQQFSIWLQPCANRGTAIYIYM